MALSNKFYEMWGLTFEGGEERTYAIDAEVRQLEEVVRLTRQLNIRLEGTEPEVDVEYTNDWGIFRDLYAALADLETRMNLNKWKIRQRDPTVGELLANLGCAIFLMAIVSYIIWVFLR